MKQIFISLILVFCASASWAQESYRGGEGDGYDRATLTVGQTSLTPESFFGGAELYPNPLLSGQDLILSFGQPVKHLKLDILDTTGRILVSEEKISTVQDIRIESGTLPPGMYLLQLSSSDQMTSLSFIILDS